MKNISLDWDVLDLTDAESKTLRALIENGTLSVSGISRKSDVARTTVDAALRRLSSRKLVRRVPRKGRLSLWKAVRIEKVKEEFLEAAGAFDRGTIFLEYEGDEGAKKTNLNEIGIALYQGKDEIADVYETLMEQQATKQVFVIYGNKSAPYGYKSPKKQYMLDFHAKFKDARIIVEGMNGELLFNVLKGLSFETLKSQANRMLVSTILEDKYMDFGVDILILRDIIFIIDIKAETVISINNKSIVEMMNCFCLLLQGNGKKINYNREVWKIIEEKEKA